MPPRTHAGAGEQSLERCTARLVTVLHLCRISWAEGRAGTLGTQVATSGSVREELRSAADDSTKPESFLSLGVRRGDLVLCMAKACPRGGLRACSTSGRDLDRSGCQLSRPSCSLLLPELRDVLSDSKSGVELALGRDLDLPLRELRSSSQAREEQAWTLCSPGGCGAIREEQRFGVEMLSPQFIMVWSLWWGFL